LATQPQVQPALKPLLKVALDVHLAIYVGAVQEEGSHPKPPQRFKPRGGRGNTCAPGAPRPRSSAY
jgi:hypothetical protein